MIKTKFINYECLRMKLDQKVSRPATPSARPLPSEGTTYTFGGLKPESQRKNLASTVLYIPNSLDSGHEIPVSTDSPPRPKVTNNTHFPSFPKLMLYNLICKNL